MPATTIELGTPKILARIEDGIGWLTFNQPEKRNAVSYEMWVAIPKIIADFEADPAVRRQHPAMVERAAEVAAL